MRYVDTNVLLRYLTGDDPAKARACFELLQRVKTGEEVVTTCEAVVTELVYVLSSRSHYELTREEIRARLVPILLLKGLRLTNRRLYLRALDVYVSYPGLDFEDALIVAHMGRHGVAEVLSYDRGFDAVAGITRVEP